MSGFFLSSCGPKFAWAKVKCCQRIGVGWGNGLLPQEFFEKREANPAILCIVAVRTE